MPTLEGLHTDFKRLAKKLEEKIPYSTANQLIKQMASVKMVEVRGGPRTGLEVRLRQFEIPALDPKKVYALQKGRGPLPSS